METQNIFDTVLNDIRAAVNSAEKQTRQYNRITVQEKYYSPEYARFKLVIYFKDGRCRWFYSYDLQKFQNSKHIDEYNSMVKLLRIIKNNAGNYKTAIIYATINEKPEVLKADYSYMIAKYDFYGNALTNDKVCFSVKDNNNKIDLYRLSQGAKVLTKN